MGSPKDKKDVGLGERGACKKNEVVKGLNKFLTSYLGLYI